jgi:hypothetical protein
MAIKQHRTYYENFNTKTFTEYVNGEITVYQEYDINNHVTYLSYPQTKEWYKWEHGENGYVIYHMDYTGYWVKTKHDEHGMLLYTETSQSGVLFDIKKNIGMPLPTPQRRPNIESLP